MHRFLCAIILGSLIVITVGCGGGGGGGSSTTNTPDPTDLTVEISPQRVTLPANGHCGFHATLTNASNSAVTWSVIEEIDGGVVGTSGNYIAPSTEGLICHVRVTSVQDPTKFADATINVSGAGTPPGGNNGVQVGISPTEVFLPAGTEMQFSATVTGHSNTAVTWSISPNGSGTILQNGTYTSPNSAATVYVTATSQADPTKSDTATVLVIPGGLPPIPL